MSVPFPTCRYGGRRCEGAGDGALWLARGVILALRGTCSVRGAARGGREVAVEMMDGLPDRCEARRDRDAKAGYWASDGLFC